MNSLLNYGNSDDDSDESGDEKYRDSVGGPSRNYRKPSQGQEDVNYDDVGMDMSEDSDKEQPPAKRDDGRRDDKRPSRESRDDRGGRGRERDRYGRDDRDRDRRRDDRSSRDDRYGRDRKERERKRSRSRDRSRKRSRTPRRSRSKSKEKGGPARGFASRRLEKATMKIDRLDKMGIELKAAESSQATAEEKNDHQAASNDRFFMPGITGRFREQIERRKMLWQKPKDQPPVQQAAPVGRNVPPPPPAGVNRSAKVWQNTSFGDDKTSNKFKRLMGIRDGGEAAATGKPATEALKKQEQMFNSMEAQYEVARAATHTMRGVGLGFGSFQR